MSLSLYIAEWAYRVQQPSALPKLCALLNFLSLDPSKLILVDALETWLISTPVAM